MRSYNCKWEFKYNKSKSEPCYATHHIITNFDNLSLHIRTYELTMTHFLRLISLLFYFYFNFNFINNIIITLHKCTCICHIGCFDFEPLVIIA